MKTKNKKLVRITTLLIIFPLLTLLLYGGLSYLFFFYTKQEDIKKEISRYEATLMMAQKNSLIEKVENLTQFIRYYNYKSGDRIKTNIKSYVNSIATIANSIYYGNKYSISKDLLKKKIMNSLKSIANVDNNNKRYFFLLDKKGMLYIHPNKKMQGTNIINLKDINGKYITKEFLSVIDNDKEGFVDYYWQKPNSTDKKAYYKITFVKSLDMFNWYIGAGEYLVDTRKVLSKEILSYVKNNSIFRDGYIFISDSHNNIVYHPYKNGIKDLNTMRLEGVYEDDEKIAYTSYVAEYDWYITAVKSMKAVKEQIKEQISISQKKIKIDNQTNLFIIILSWIVSILISLYLSWIVAKMLLRYEKQLQESNQKLVFQSRQALIGELFSMIAHQWRQPINKIASIVAPLRFRDSDEVLSNEELDKELQKIEESVEFMSETIDDFRTFYKPKDVSEVVRLDDIIRKSLEFLSGAIRKKDVIFIKSLAKIEVKTHSNEFLQVIINIIKNAIDAVEQRGNITILLYQEKGKAILKIRDNGVGVKEDKLGKIFEPYYTTKSDSMGLGLYMCKLIIEKHLNGTIEAKRLKKGLEFTIKLPTFTA